MTDALRRQLEVRNAKPASEGKQAAGSEDLRVPAWVPGWLEKARPLAGEDPELRKQWDSLEQRAHRSYFELVILGETGRGKTSTLRELLSDATIPETDPERPLHLVAGEAGLIREFNEPARSFGDQNSVPEMAPINLRISSAWMREQDIQIWELPSNCFDEGSPSARPWPMADCILQVLQATAPFGQLEKAQVRGAVEHHAVPLVAVVARHLDRVPKKDWARVLAFISDQAESIDGDIRTVLAGPGVGEDRAAVSKAGSEARYLDLAGLKGLLESERRSPRHRRRVSHQLATRGLAYLDGAKKRLAQAIERWRLEGKKRAKAQAATRAEAQKRIDLCKTAAQAWQLRKVDAIDALRSQLEEQRSKITEGLRTDLDRSSNPKVWLDRDLPPRLESELQRAESQLGSRLSQRLLEDRRILDPLQKKHGLRLTPASRVQVNLPPPKDTSGGEIESANVLDPAWMSRLTRIAGAAVGSLLFWKLQLLALLPSTLVSQLGEGWVGRRLEKAKSELGAALGVEIDELWKNHRIEAVNALSKVYDEVLTEIRATEATWHNTFQEISNSEPLLPEELTDSLHLAERLEVELERRIHAIYQEEEELP